MGLGDDLKAAVLEMITEDGGFGSLISVKFNARSVNMATGAVTVTAVTQATFGAVASPIDVEPFFGNSTLTSMSSAVIVTPDALTDPPEIHDEVAVESGVYLRIIDIEKLVGPSSVTVYPVVIAYVLALGT
jgi:hypothetical protein